MKNMLKKKYIIAILLISAVTAICTAEEITVYITKSGSKYHLAGCPSLKGNGIPIVIDEAVARGYEPCKRCNPPGELSAAAEPENKQPAFQPYGFEELALPYCENTDDIVRHHGYSLLYSEPDEQALWVAYLLTSDETEGNYDRTDNFRADPDIKTGSAELSDYKGSGYDRGHLAPAADLKWSAESISDSFYLSNMSPQSPGFNRGIWKELENWVRKKAEKNFEIFVVTGPVLSGGPFIKIGRNNVSVPDYYFKVILDYFGPDKKAIGFILPNESSQKPLSEFSVSVDEVEDITGLDFFFMLEDDTESNLESRYAYSEW